MAPPANDNFANATALTGTSGTQTLNTLDATFESLDPEPEFGAATTWYKYEPSTDGLFVAHFIAAVNDAWYLPYAGAYSHWSAGAGIHDLRRIAYTDMWSYGSGAGASVPNAYMCSLYFVMNHSNTYWIEVSQDTNDIDPAWGDRLMEWEVISTPTWGTPPAATPSTDPLAIAMNGFGGSAFPSAADANGGRWIEPDGYAARGRTILTADGLVLETYHGSGVGSGAYLNYSTATDATGELQEEVTIAGDVEFTIGMQTNGLVEQQELISGTSSPVDNNAFGWWVWKKPFTTTRLGFQMSDERYTPSLMGIYLPGNSSVSAWWAPPVGWPFRMKYKYVDATDTWTCEISVDGGTSWLLVAQETSTVMGTYVMDYAMINGDAAGLGWKLTFEGWSGGAAAEAPRVTHQTFVDERT